jgi:PAS domain S-box-containing protein
VSTHHPFPWSAWQPIVTILTAIVATFFVLWTNLIWPAVKKVGSLLKHLNPLHSLARDIAAIRKELTSNSGSSLKDAVYHIRDQQKVLGEAAKHTGARVTALLDGRTDMIWESDLQGRQVWANAALVAMTGRPASELLGGGWINVIHGDDRTRIKNAWIESVAGQYVFNEECRCVRPDDRVIKVRLIAKPYPTDGAVVCWIGTATIRE